ncbi:hypothetical protein QOZ80_1BG0053850 [Eleusine coracana subsp. coracana]|nr:hypothetical protein QOZ80_1BG0053850 [Eleusine coracana subsp. coracana]
MDALVSAVASDLIGRLISFLVGKYQESSAADISDTIVRLQRALLRARVVVEEAEGRQIANRAMLQQLSQLRRQLCRAAYALDAFMWRDDRRSRGTVMSRRSRSSQTIRLILPPPSSVDDDVLSVMVESLEAALRNMREFVVLLNGCPRVSRQPYSAYLFMESCMFGRQMEKEAIVSFLLQPARDLAVLPIIGPHDVGKRTLVEHVCLDERVRVRFTEIHRLSSHDLRSPEHHYWSLFDFTARSLTVIDIINTDADAEESWRTFHSAILRRRTHGGRGSKIIVIGRTEAHLSLGTVPPLRLHPPHREELWYFFRALAFGAADPDDRPDLVPIAMALCERMTVFATFIAANIIAALLRADLSACSWRHVLKVISEITVMHLGAAGNRLDEDKAGRYYLSQPLKDIPDFPCLVYNRRKLTGMTESELPKVTIMELLTGGFLFPPGEKQFDILEWQSHIPPYTSYVLTCNIDKEIIVI